MDKTKEISKFVHIGNTQTSHRRGKVNL